MILVTITLGLYNHVTEKSEFGKCGILVNLDIGA